ncbi:MAG: protein kinase [Myxococcota bacterium]|nr:protein kinase [Myxococcota bacterium]
MIGTRIGNYRLVRLVGSGSMGVVYEAVHEAIGKRVAVKVLHGPISQDPVAHERFAREARALTSSEHPGIVQIFDFGLLPEGMPYMVMEFLQGEPLSLRLRRTGPLSSQVAMRFGRQIASALAEAHSRGVVHRDLKPDNVVIAPDPEAQGGERARVLDFGIAMVLGEQGPSRSGGAGGSSRAGPITGRGPLLGTPAYMSPEQCRGTGPIDERTDVYALGCMLFEMLTGRPPFVSADRRQLVAAHLSVRPPLLRRLDPTARPELEALLQRMLAKLPAERPSMAHVAAELLALEEQPSGALLALSPPLASSTLHGVGERIEPVRGWGRPPAALWVVAGLALLAPSTVLLWRHKGGGPAERALMAPPRPQAMPLPVAEPEAPTTQPKAPSPPPVGPAQGELPLRTPAAGKLARRAPLASAASQPQSSPRVAPSPGAQPPPPPPAVAAAPASAPEPEQPKNVAAALTRGDRLEGALPSLPAVLRSQYRGTGPLTLAYRVCVDRNGQVSTVQPVAGAHPADDSVLEAVRSWRYRPRPIPVCFVETFTFVIE